MVLNDVEVEITCAPAALARVTRPCTSANERIGWLGSPVADWTLRSIFGPRYVALGSHVGSGAPGTGSPSADVARDDPLSPWGAVQTPTPPMTRTSAAPTTTSTPATPSWVRRRTGNRQCRPPNAWRSQGTPSAISTPIATSQPIHRPRAPPMIPPVVAPTTS